MCDVSAIVADRALPTNARSRRRSARISSATHHPGLNSTTAAEQIGDVRQAQAVEARSPARRGHEPDEAEAAGASAVSLRVPPCAQESVDAARAGEHVEVDRAQAARRLRSAPPWREATRRPAPAAASAEARQEISDLVQETPTGSSSGSQSHRNPSVVRVSRASSSRGCPCRGIAGPSRGGWRARSALRRRLLELEQAEQPRALRGAA